MKNDGKSDSIFLNSVSFKVLSTLLNNRRCWYEKDKKINKNKKNYYVYKRIFEGGHIKKKELK